MKRYYIIVLILTLACNKKDEFRPGIIDVSQMAEIKFETLRPDQPINWDNLIDSVRVVVLETRTESLIAELSKLMVHRNRIIIHDQKQKNIFLFDLNGKFISKLAIGDGPEEVKDIRDFDVTENGNIVVLALRDIIIYDENAEIVEKIRYTQLGDYNPIQFGWMRGGGYCFWNGSYLQKSFNISGAYMLSIINPDLIRIESEYFKVEREVLENRRFRSSNGDFLLTPRIYSDTIYKLDGKMRTVSAKYKVDFQGQSLNNNIHKYSEDQSESYILFTETNSGSLCGNIREISSSDELVHFIYGCGKNLYQVLYFTDSKTTINGLAYDSNGIFKSLRVRYILKDYIYFSYEIGELLEARITFEQRKDSGFITSEILAQTSRVDESSNPVICIAKIKEQ